MSAIHRSDRTACYPPAVRRALLLFVLVFALGACSQRPPAAAVKPRAASSSPSVPPSPQPPPLCPLTGEEAAEGFDVDSPALAVKIDNAAPARPQAGLQEADIVYEELAEGGITRFLAVFHCSGQVEVGPVRSARLVDADILREYQPVLFAYSGANSQVRSKVASTGGIVDLPHGRYGKVYRRKKGRPGPHDLFTTVGELRALSDAGGPPHTGLTFAPANPPEAPPEGSAGSGAGPAGPAGDAAGSPSEETARAGAVVSFTFAGSQPTRYVFEESSGDYLRFHGEVPHLVDGGRQLRVTNVVVIKVRVRRGEIRDAAGNLSPEITVVGSGEAWVFTRGSVAPLRWTRDSLSDRMTLTNGAGRVQLSPGNTWIHLLPSDRTVSVTSTDPTRAPA